MSERTRNRRENGTGCLGERFESNIHVIEKTVCQDEKDFTLEVPVNLRTIVYMVNERNQISLMKIYLVQQTR